MERLQRNKLLAFDTFDCVTNETQYCFREQEWAFFKRTRLKLFFVSKVVEQTPITGRLVFYRRSVSILQG